MSEKQQIIDKSDLRKWRTELPNLYFEIGLDPYELALLSHYKRVGNCNESVETTAAKTQMSTGKVSQVRHSLWKKWKLITLTRNKYGGFNVKVKDIWEDNFAFFSKRKAEKEKRASRGEGVHQVKKGFTTRRGASPHDEGLHQVKQRSNNSKKQQIKKELVKKQQQHPPAADADTLVLLDRLGIEEPTRTELATMKPDTAYLEGWLDYKKAQDKRAAERGTPALGGGFFVKRIRDNMPVPRVRRLKWTDGYDQFVNR